MYWSGDHLLYYNKDSDAMSFDEKALSKVITKKLDVAVITEKKT